MTIPSTRFSRRTLSWAMLGALLAMACFDAAQQLTGPRPGAPLTALNPAGLIVTTPTNMRGWYFMDDDTGLPCPDATRCRMVTGPGTTPVGTGSAELASTTTADATLALDE